MSRINSNIPSLIARANLSRSNDELEVRLQRLATGLRINRGADDPAGLIISERIRSDIEGVNQGIANAERASSVISTAESALAEVSDLLNSIKSLMVESANTGANSKDERDANQLQIDSAIDSITRISNTASFGQLKLLNGELDYTLSGVNMTQIDNARVLNASFVGQQNLQVEVDVLASAQTAGLYLNGDNPGAAVDGILLSATSLRISGNAGVTELSFAVSATMSDIANAVNNLTSFTGVRAEVINGNDASGLVFRSVDYGSNSFVSVERIDGPPDPADDNFRLFKFDDNAPIPDFTGGFPWGGPSLTSAKRDTGRDVSALVNGNLARGDGLVANINSASLGMRLELDPAFATDPTATNSTFYITGGGSLFQIGPDITPQQQVNIGIQSVAASQLGGTLVNGSLRFLNSLKSGQGFSIEENVDTGDFTDANEVLDKAIDEIAILRGRLGAFERNVLDPNVRSLQSAFENLSASSSQVRDADFAVETSELTRAQILSSAGTSVLALANQQSQQVLQLLG